MRRVAALALTVLALACVARQTVVERPPELAEADPGSQAGESIVVCGEPVPIGAPVVLWFAPGGYNAYRTELRFPDEVPADPEWEAPSGLRYRPGRETETARATRRTGVEQLGRVVDQLVLHYDACGTSRTCFQVLHDRRGLSCHFLLDVDGTLYQTLDLADTAWHARQANPRSIGVEIANLGAYPPGEYPLDDAGPLVRGTVNGHELEMVPYTAAQYETLAKLTKALCELFPELRPDVPRDADGPVRRDVLSDEEFARFRGVLGHSHVSVDKTDPGPALDWERVLSEVR